MYNPESNQEKKKQKLWVAYVRKSIDNESNQNQSLKDQSEYLQEWAVKQNFKLHDVIYDDVISGVAEIGDGVKQRKGLNEAFKFMEASANQVTGLVVIKLDRFSRDTLQTLLLLKRLQRNNLSFTCALEPEL